ncbi:MAG: dockerin type I domain-containing protein [Clostridiales bacterium]|nr:MAG: dockerin type I domain-containing protein [Clostridiales bacterium]
MTKAQAKVAVGFEPVEGNDRLYNIVVTAKDTSEINRLNTADLTFKLTASNEEDSDVAYAITPAEDISIVADETNADRYVFYFNGKTGVTADTGKSITIGTAEFTGYTKNKATVSFETLIDDSVVTATTKVDNLVTEYVVKGDALSAEDNIYDVEFTVPTRKLTVNVKFPQKVNYKNDEAYQAMNVTISGPGVNKSFDLGKDTKYIASALRVTEELPENTAYTVTVSGDGYRTARYTVMLTKSKTLTFWNNVMTEDVNVEEGNDNSARKVTFLAGDIVKDNKINIYDLSAVVSYFGTKADTSAESVYAKYDLNRDGVIDSRDIAYVLASWGN